MLQAVLARVEERLEALGLSATAASKKAGLSEDAIRNLRRAVEKGDTRQGISTRTVQALAPVLETTAAYLLNGPVAEVFGATTRVPLAGRIVAGGVIDVSTEQDEPGVEYEVELSAQIADAVVAYQVIGESMLPVYRPNTVLICRAHTTDIDSLLGRELAVGTKDQGRMLKTVHAGSRPGVYDLESLNAKTMRDVELAWVARIAAIIPADEWRIIERRVQVQQQKREALKKPSQRKRANV